MNTKYRYSDFIYKSLYIYNNITYHVSVNIEGIFDIWYFCNPWWLVALQLLNKPSLHITFPAHYLYCWLLTDTKLVKDTTQPVTSSHSVDTQYWNTGINGGNLWSVCWPRIEDRKSCNLFLLCSRVITGKQVNIPNHVFCWFTLFNAKQRTFLLGTHNTTIAVVRDAGIYFYFYFKML